ncbi:GH92 family glycosyl hydrolase [Dyadobacter sandarakinus]|uniref:Glycoside hydrolase family 92 protein n=1 Tax=Dyadobacter sandarakinus TaxID=2747268 RepID=A0ABX7I6I1_9BACT|nr:GH92 family glycosyl hydrolase [Dyadobacter sandarakinus]QRR01333.1 glycoside hydrolase family 92 protein [Dyadobacter sandarakinus]
MKYRIIACAAVLGLLSACGSRHEPDKAAGRQEPAPAEYVNPLIGASTSTGKAGVYHGLGKTFPGATTPYGLVQVSPNTITGGDNGSGYSFEHTSIEGFAFTQMSGVGWYGDLGNLLVMPAAGPLRTARGQEGVAGSGYRSGYSKKDEKASAGYYAATLTDYGIRAEMTAAPHSGMLRFTFPQNEKSCVQIDLARRVGGTSTRQYVQVVNDHTIRGWMQCTPEGGGWGNGDGHAEYTVYFYAQFSKPFKKLGAWKADIPKNWKRKREDVESRRYQEQVAKAAVLDSVTELEGDHIGVFAEYNTEKNDQILFKSGISFVSMDGARKNLEKEISSWDFDGLHRQAVALWNQALSAMTIAGGSDEEKRIFYTALYHTMIDPRMFADADGSFTGGDGKVHTSADYTRRTIFSGWDVFRSQFPLQSIIHPRLVNDVVSSLLSLADERKKTYLERWEMLNAYSGCMIGNPALSVIADANAKGIARFDKEKALQYAVQTSNQFGNGERGYTVEPFGISNTLEYAYTEWCTATLARSLGKTDVAAVFEKRGQSYRNIFDPEKGWFRPKDKSGNWQSWPDGGRLKQWYGSIEANAYQQGWFVPQDIPGMVALMGGPEKVASDLTTFFEKVPENMMWNDYYNHANEPVHHVPFLFNHVGKPWLTQKWTRAICRRAYHNSVEGLVGNEDVGQMSAWYVLAASGLYQVCPGNSRFEITSPVFEEVTVRLDPDFATGKQFTIIAHGNSPANLYIQRAKLNGKAYDKCYLDYKDISAGGTLELTMGPEPNQQFGD